MQKDLKRVMAGEMEVVVNEERSVYVVKGMKCSQVTGHAQECSIFLMNIKKCVFFRNLS
jgi:nitrogen regulatory protein PII